MSVSGPESLMLRSSYVRSSELPVPATGEYAEGVIQEEAGRTIHAV